MSNIEEINYTSKNILALYQDITIFMLGKMSEMYYRAHF